MTQQKLFRWAAASFMWALVALPVAAEQVAWQTNLENAMAEARDTNRPLLLHFWTPDCVPCRRLEKNVLNQTRVVEALESQFIPVKVNAQEQPELARRYHVSSVPVDVIVSPRNEELARLFTPQDPDRYVAQLSAIGASTGATSPSSRPIASSRAGATSVSKAATPDPAMADSEPGEEVAEEAETEAEVAAVATEDSTNGEMPTSVAAKDAAPGRSSSSPSDEPEPREVINRFARQNQDEMPRARSSKTAASSRSRWSRDVVEEPVVESSDTDPSEPESSPADQLADTPANQSVSDSHESPKGPASRPAAAQTARAKSASPMGLDGYCPVTLVEKQAWKKGDPRYGVVHRGRTYLFAGPEEKEIFFARPDEYSPALSGIDPVEYAERGEVLDGRRDHGVVYQNHVYLFSSEKNLDSFWKDPERYSRRIQQAMETGDVNSLRR